MPKNGKPKSKVCADCRVRKKLDQFGKNPRMRLGRKSYCIECTRTRQREWNAEHRGTVPRSTSKKASPAKRKKVMKPGSK